MSTHSIAFCGEIRKQIEITLITKMANIELWLRQVYFTYNVGVQALYSAQVPNAW